MLSKRTDIFLHVYVSIFICLTACLWSGFKLWLYPYFAGSAILLLLILAFLWIKALFTRTANPNYRPGLDPLFPVGLLFMAYTGIQAWNSGRTMYFDEPRFVWDYTLPPHPSLPYSFNQGEATRVMIWFLVAWALILTIRFLINHGNPTYWKRSLLALILNANILVCLGLYKFFFTPGKLLGTKVSHGFFSTFPYTNHAAAYFVMIAALAAGLLITEMLKKPGTNKKQRSIYLGFLTASLFLNVVGANFSLSRAGIILAWALTVLVAIYMLRKSWRILRPAARVNLAAASIAAVAVFYYFISGFGSEQIQRQFEVSKQPVLQMIPQLMSINLDLTVRPALWKAGWDVFRANWLFGTGGWGFRYMAGMHVHHEDWKWVLGASGRANVHNDPIQFLSEFGVVGNAFLIAGLIILIYPICNRKAWQNPLIFMTCTGLILVYIFGIIDLPYRCPAILWAWCVLLAWLPGLHKHTKIDHHSSKHRRHQKTNPWQAHLQH